MNKNTKLSTPRLPKLVGDLMHSNQFMKMFSLYALTLVLVTSLALMFAVTKEPIILTLNTQAEVITQAGMPRADDQVKEAVKAYLHTRYRWKPDNVVKKLKSAEAFILPVTIKAFQPAVSKVAKFSMEKMVSQNVYPEVMKVDLLKKTVLVLGDRITSIQGMKAVGDLRLEISFESGPRTKDNPWGVYVIKETEH